MTPTSVKRDDQRRLMVKDNTTSLNVNTSNALKFPKYNFYLKDYLKKSSLFACYLSIKKNYECVFFLLRSQYRDKHIYINKIIISYLVNN